MKPPLSRHPVRSWLARALPAVLLAVGPARLAARDGENAGDPPAAKPAASRGLVEHSGLAPASEAASRDGSLILLVFGAEWCGPCKLLDGKTLSSEDFRSRCGAIQLVHIDIDAAPETAQSFQVGPIPDLILLTPEMQIVARRPGYQDTESLLAWIEEGRRRVASGVWEGTVAGESARGFHPATASEDDWRALVQILGHRDPAERDRASKYLRLAREAAVPYLLEGLGDRYLAVRLGAHDVLSRLAPGAPAIDPWSPGKERETALAALRQWWKREPTLPAETDADSLSPSESRAAGEALRAVFESDPIRRTDALSTLVHLGEAVLPGLREAIERAAGRGDQKTLWVLEDARWAILVPDILERDLKVRRALARGRSAERQEATLRLAKGGRLSLPALRELASDADPLVRENVIHALGMLGGREALEAMALLLEATDSNVRMVAAQQLGRSKDTAMGVHLGKVVRDADELVACVAIAALEEIKGVGEADALIACLKDPRWRVRAAAAEVLGKLKIEKATGELVVLLSDDDPFVVKAAAGALKKLRHEPTPQQIGELKQLVERQPDLANLVTEMLLESNSVTAVATIQGLFEGADAEGRRLIVKALSGASFNGGLTEASWDVFLEMLSSSTDPELRIQLAGLLGPRSAAQRARFLPPLLRDGDPRVREAAAQRLLEMAAHHWGVSPMRGRRDDYGVLARFPEELEVEREGELVAPDAKRESSRGGKKEPGDQEATGEPKPSGGGFFGALSRIFGGGSSPPRVERKAGEKLERARANEIYRSYREYRRVLAETAASGKRGPMMTLARYVLGDPVEGLAELDTLDAEDLARLGTSELGLLLKRLPWPGGRALLERASASSEAYPGFVVAARHAAPALRAYLLEPGRLIPAVERADDLGRALFAQSLLGRDDFDVDIDIDFQGGAIVDLESPDEAAPPAGQAGQRLALVSGLLASRSGFARALGLGMLDEKSPPALQEIADGRRFLEDGDPWVRRAAVRAILKRDLEQREREDLLAPLLSDEEGEVAALAAIAMLDARLREQVEFYDPLSRFQYGDTRYWTSYSFSASFYSGDTGPLFSRIERQPAFLAVLRERLRSDEAAEPAPWLQPFALLLAQYGDASGLDLELERWQKSREEAAPEFLKAGLILTGDPKYLATLRADLKDADDDWDLEQLLKWTRGVKGKEVEAFNAELNKRMRAKSSGLLRL